MGISAIYEYAARAIGANKWDANFEVRKIGNELLKIINHPTCNKTYEINEDF